MIFEKRDHLLWFLHLAIFRALEQDILFMRRALELARLGFGNVSHNPMVGCVVVAENRIIGEGWHRKYGGPHAEVNALESVTDQSLLSKATVYVNLEPCSHFGKTPPCADKLVQVGVKRVVVSNRDTHPLVSGKGIEKLRAAGIAITEGILEKEGRYLNRRFFTTVEQGIPFIILKWAESSDGYIAQEGTAPVWISSVLSRQRVHQWRSGEDGVLIGATTAEVDNPRLNVRDWTGRNPKRIVIDRSLRLGETLNIFDGSQPTLCYNLKRSAEQANLTLIKLSGENFIPDLLHDLKQRNLGSIIVEGGAQTLNAFIAGGWWHEARIFRAKKSLGSGIAAPVLRGNRICEDELSDDRLTVLINPSPAKT